MAKRAQRRRESSAALLLEVHCTKLSVGPDTDNGAVQPLVPSIPIALALPSPPPSPGVAPRRSSGELRLCFRTGCTSVARLGGGERSINDERRGPASRASRRARAAPVDRPPLLK